MPRWRCETPLKGTGVRELGEIHERSDTTGKSRLRVVVVSHDLYRDATGMVFVCPIVPDDGAAFDHPMLVRARALEQRVIIVPDEVYRMPAAGLGNEPLSRLDKTTLDRVRAVIRGIFG